MTLRNGVWSPSSQPPSLSSFPHGGEGEREIFYMSLSCGNTTTSGEGGKLDVFSPALLSSE
jgi:hypothetical protein